MERRFGNEARLTRAMGLTTRLSAFATARLGVPSSPAAFLGFASIARRQEQNSGGLLE